MHWVILHAFFKISFFEKIFQEYHQSIKQFGSRSGPTFCRPDLGPNCLQKLSAHDTSRPGMNHLPVTSHDFFLEGIFIQVIQTKELTTYL